MPRGPKPPPLPPDGAEQVNFSKTKSLYRHGMTPIVRSTSRPAWERLPPKSVFYYKSPRHKNNYVLSFVFVFDEPNDDYEFAYTYPYTFTRLQRQLASWDRAAHRFCTRELLCRTPQMRRVDVLTICEPPGDCMRPSVPPPPTPQASPSPHVVPFNVCLPS